MARTVFLHMTGHPIARIAEQQQQVVRACIQCRRYQASTLHSSSRRRALTTSSRIIERPSSKSVYELELPRNRRWVRSGSRCYRCCFFATLDKTTALLFYISQKRWKRR